MVSLAELSRFHTELTRAEIRHLQRLVASWGLLADLCFADLMLFVGSGAATAAEPGGTPDRSTAPGAPGRPPERLVVVGQVLPTTGQTLYRSDWVGRVLDRADRPLVARCLELGEIIDGEVTSEARKEVVRELCIPVRHRDRTIGVLTRESTPAIGRQPGELERTYVEVFNRFARMIASGSFPFEQEEGANEEAPRVGDGVILLDSSMRVAYASPNAVSALHRIGVHANTEGMRLGDVGMRDLAVRISFTKARPATEEIERGAEITVLVRSIPLLERDKVTGALVLLRDISELRRRDRLLISKDATIREIHHRVKNNLQTISSLLNLQGRRLSSEEAKVAIDESVRRIRSIALVHETLSHEAGDDVPFAEIVRPLVRMVEEGLMSPDRPIYFEVVGDPGRLPATVATPLAVVLTEALQNVVEHAYPPGGDLPGGKVRIELASTGHELVVQVVDDGVGLPTDFRIEAAGGLGLSIVRTLVTTELGGTIKLYSAGGPPERPGTAVELRVPLDAPRDTGQVPVVSAGAGDGGGSPDATRPPEPGGR
jgi:two-component system, sensor histidine kinase PdtaS